MTRDSEPAVPAAMETAAGQHKGTEDPQQNAALPNQGASLFDEGVMGDYSFASLAPFPQPQAAQQSGFPSQDDFSFEASALYPWPEPLPYPSQLLPQAPTPFVQPSYIAVPEEVLNHVPTGSSVIEPDSYMDESGRTYHGYKQGKYFLPNDAAEQDRLDLQHAAIMLGTDGRLACAPMEKPPKYVMDVATGTGIWALEFARQNPTSFVVGTDLSKIQPENTPPNCEFYKDDAEEEWIFPNLPTFDYIHLRIVWTCFGQPKRVLKNAWDNLAPGGWIEYQDMHPVALSSDGSHEGTIMQRYWDLMREGLAARGRDPMVTSKYKSWLEELGCVNVKEIKIPFPGNTWPKDPRFKQIGLYTYTDMSEGARGIAFQLFRGLGMSPEEIEDVAQRFKQQCGDTKVHVYYNMYVVYGQKPLNAA